MTTGECTSDVLCDAHSSHSEAPRRVRSVLAIEEPTPVPDIFDYIVCSDAIRAKDC